MTVPALSRTASLAAGCLLLLLPALPLDAQPGPEERSELGRHLRAQSLAVAATGDVSGAADQLLWSAYAPGVLDLERAKSLRLAGRLYHHAGDLDRARRTLVRAGLVAYHAGDPELSVRLFLDAAQAAAEDGKTDEAWRAAERAGYVLRTEEVTLRQRLAALGRVVYADQPAVLQIPGPLATQATAFASH